MRTYALENRGRAPLYEYLYRCIRGDILDGTLTAGERLPSKRALAEHLHISVMTVEGAYQQLEAEGYVYTQPKRGFFVAEVERPRPAVLIGLFPITNGAMTRGCKIFLNSRPPCFTKAIARIILMPPPVEPAQVAKLEPNKASS